MSTEHQSDSAPDEGVGVPGAEKPADASLPPRPEHGSQPEPGPQPAQGSQPGQASQPAPGPQPYPGVPQAPYEAPGQQQPPPAPQQPGRTAELPPVPAAAGGGHHRPPPPGGGYAYPMGGAPFGSPQQPPHVYDTGRRRRRYGIVGLVAATALVAGGIGGGIGAWASGNDNGSNSASTTVSSSVNQASLNRSPKSIAGIVAKDLPSVVTIHATGSSESGTGSGFVYDKQGHILTNNHVVAPAANGGTLTVQFSDGKSYKATVVGRAPGYDVAVIKLVDPKGAPLVPLALGNSDNVAVGDTAIAIGAPFGLSGTVTDGIISAKNRPVASGSEDGSQSSYMNAIQTDASINPGNSGGPLINSSGQVVGINSAIQAATDTNNSSGQAGSIGLGFAIPINQAEWVANQLIKNGKATYASLGVLTEDSDNGQGAQIPTSGSNGTEPVTPGGPAAKAGLKPGDVITKLDDTQIDSGPTLISEIWSHKPGDKVKITYKRNGTTHTTEVTLGSRDADSTSNSASSNGNGNGNNNRNNNGNGFGDNGGSSGGSNNPNSIPTIPDFPGFGN